MGTIREPLHTRTLTVHTRQGLPASKEYIEWCRKYARSISSSNRSVSLLSATALKESMRIISKDGVEFVEPPYISQH